MKISTFGFMFKILVFWRNFTFYTWNWLLSPHVKFVSFSIWSTHICMKRGEHVSNTSNFTFHLSECFKHFQFLSYLLVTLHLPWPLADGEASKADKMSWTHPNLNLSDVLSSIIQGEHMSRNPFLYFWFDQLQHWNPNLGVDQNQQIALSQVFLIRSEIWR